MSEFFWNAPPIVIHLVKIFIIVLGLLWFIVPFIIMDINKKMKKMFRGFQELADSLDHLSEEIDKQRKDSNIDKLMQNKEI